LAIRQAGLNNNLRILFSGIDNKGGLIIVTNLKLGVFLAVVGIICVLVLPGLPISRAAATSHVAGQKPSRTGLNGSRHAALEKLFNQLKSGDVFSEEETIILRKFGEGGVLTDLEADVVIVRALYSYYIAGMELTKEQQELLDRYQQFVARRPNDVADRKTQLLNRRIAAEAAAAPRNTPLVAPANDLCTGGEVIPGAGPFPYVTAVTADITDATTNGDPPLPNCQTNASRSVWYTFTPTTTADYIVSSCADGPTATTVDDTVMGIYTSSGSCGGSFSELPTAGTTRGCDDDSCNTGVFQAVIQTRLNAGTQYFIVVWQFGASPPLAGRTAVQLRITQILGPANDVCAGAIPLSLDTPANGTTAAAGADYLLSGSPCFTGTGNTPSTVPGRDVVYSFAAPVAGNYSFKVTNYDVVNDLVVYLSTSCPAPGTLTCGVAGPAVAAANRMSTGGSEEVFCWPLTAGQQVFLFVDEDKVTAGSSSFTIEATTCTSETEPNNTPAQASNVVPGIQGSISPGTDVDFYSLGTPPPGSRIFAMVDGVAATISDFDLRVTTTTDTLEYDDFSNDALFGSLAPNVGGTPATGAPTFLRVNTNTGTPSEPYRLYSAVQPPLASATAETEPNGTIELANSAANNYFTGSLSGPAPSADIDIFSFTAVAGDLVFVSLDGDPLRDSSPINASVEVLDSLGGALISVNDPGSISSTTTGAGSLTSTTPFSPAEGLVVRIKANGTYYVSVSIGTVSTAGSGAGDYLLSIAKPVSTPGSDTLGVYDPTSQTFYLRNDNTPGNADIVIAYGPPGGIPVVGDWNGDGTTTIGVYDPGDRTFYLRNSNTAGFADIVIQYGPPGSTPVVGDWDGDGVTTIGVYETSTRTFYLRNSNTLGFADIVIQYGPNGGIPLAGDWDGDGDTTIGVYDPSSQTFYLRNSNTVGLADLTLQYGPPDAIPVMGDWDSNGTVTLGVYDPTSRTFYLRNSNTVGVADITISYGPAGAIPLGGDWDGQ
jgi:hypothetical protein